MVCPRCIRVVNEELQKAGFKVSEVELGIAVLDEIKPDKVKLAKVLKENGFELLEEKSTRLVNEIKAFIISYIRDGQIANERLKLSSLLEDNFSKEYGRLSHIFSSPKTITL